MTNDFLHLATSATSNEWFVVKWISQLVTSDFLQRVTAGTSNKQILLQVTSEFLQRVGSKFCNE